MSVSCQYHVEGAMVKVPKNITPDSHENWWSCGDGIYWGISKVLDQNFDQNRFFSWFTWEFLIWTSDWTSDWAFITFLDALMWFSVVYLIYAYDMSPTTIILTIITIWHKVNY